MVQFTLRQLRFFAEVARHGGIAPAAQHLNVSAPAVSASIDKLELITGLKLFDRFPARGMKLTRSGSAFLSEAEALLARSEAVSRHATDLAVGRAGSIRIATHHAIAQKIVLPAVLAFRESHPSVRIEIIEGEYADLIAALDARDVDALVVFDQGFDHSSHVVEKLMELPPLALLASSHNLAAKKSVTLRDLIGLPYIALSHTAPGSDYLQLLQAAGVHPEIPLTSQSRELVQAYVGKGLGFTLVGFPPHIDRTIEGDPVVARPLVEQIGGFEAVLVKLRAVHGNALVDAFFELCRKQVSKPLSN